MYESISKNNELENEMTLDMSYFWYLDDVFIWQEMGLVHLATDIHSCVLIKSPSHMIQIVSTF